MKSALIVLALAGAAFADPCALDSNFPSGYKGLKIPLKQTATDKSGTLAVEGNVVIIDKCSFTVTDFTLAGKDIAAKKIRFYAAPVNSTLSYGFPLTDDYFTKNYQKETGPTFQLSQVPGTLQTGISYKDISGFRLFVESEQLLLAEGMLSSGTPGGSIPTGTGSGSVKPGTPSNAVSIASGILAMVTAGWSLLM